MQNGSTTVSDICFVCIVLGIAWGLLYVASTLPLNYSTSQDDSRPSAGTQKASTRVHMSQSHGSAVAKAHIIITFQDMLVSTQASQEAQLGNGLLMVRRLCPAPLSLSESHI